MEQNPIDPGFDGWLSSKPGVSDLHHISLAPTTGADVEAVHPTARVSNKRTDLKE